MADIEIQLTRLTRHYQHARDTYDPVSLLDLAHALRVWAEMAPDLAKSHPAFDTTIRFKTALPAKKVLKASVGVPFIFAYLGGMTFSRAGRGRITAQPPIPDGQDYALGCSIKVDRGTDGLPDGMHIGHYAYVERSLGQPIIKAMGSETITRVNFSHWLAGEAVKIRRRDEKGILLPSLGISRHMMIKRVSNTMGASHPESDAGKTQYSNSFDAPIEALMAHKVADLPLPYFILLKCAQDILEIAPDLLKK
jgi:hypothetical protein